MHKAPLGRFLARNPFPNGLTDGLFYREKMRAIHRIAPARLREDDVRPRVLDIGGGRSGLAALLYPQAEVVAVDLDPALGAQAPADAPQLFACADACSLPFADGTFDAVTLFDVLEHVETDRAAAAEALRVVRPGGQVLVSTPTAAWRYPYYAALRRVCPHETELMAEWGHVRRGYADGELQEIFGARPERRTGFINPITAFYHDIAFSRLGRRRRKLIYALAAPITALGYIAHAPGLPGTETAAAWRK